MRVPERVLEGCCCTAQVWERALWRTRAWPAEQAGSWARGQAWWGRRAAASCRVWAGSEGSGPRRRARWGGSEGPGRRGPGARLRAGPRGAERGEGPRGTPGWGAGRSRAGAPARGCGAVRPGPLGPPPGRGWGGAAGGARKGRTGRGLWFRPIAGSSFGTELPNSSSTVICFSPEWALCGAHWNDSLKA